MIQQIPVISQPEILDCGDFAIRITELTSEGWPEGYTWTVTDRDGLLEYASGDVDFPGELGFKKALRTARAVCKSVAEADAQGAH